MSTDSKIMARALQRYREDVEKRRQDYDDRVAAICRPA